MDWISNVQNKNDKWRCWGYCWAACDEHGFGFEADGRVIQRSPIVTVSSSRVWVLFDVCLMTDSYFRVDFLDSH